MKDQEQTKEITDFEKRFLTMWKLYFGDCQCNRNIVLNFINEELHQQQVRVVEEIAKERLYYHENNFLWLNNECEDCAKLHHRNIGLSDAIEIVKKII